MTVDPEHIIKEQTDPVASNKRNTRKKRNRNVTLLHSTYYTSPSLFLFCLSGGGTVFYTLYFHLLIHLYITLDVPTLNLFIDRLFDLIPDILLRKHNRMLVVTW